MTDKRSDDTFDLYDLLVEVICPPGERIMCGAKEGDSFRLEGEMLYLPPGQGFSIYSLGIYIQAQSSSYSMLIPVYRLYLAPVGSETASDAPK
jgi:hypothetical protein